MPKSTLAGHPLHPQIISAPAGLLPASLVLDTMHLATGNQSYADAAYYTMMGGVIGGAAAGIAGAMDYLTIPSGAPVKREANLHAALNISLLGLFGANLLMRRGKRSPGKLPVLLSLVGNTGLLASAWYGGDMVYTHGMRVKGVSPVENAPQVAPPGDQAVARTMERVARSVPANGPHM